MYPPSIFLFNPLVILYLEFKFLRYNDYALFKVRSADKNAWSIKVFILLDNKDTFASFDLTRASWEERSIISIPFENNGRSKMDIIINAKSIMVPYIIKAYCFILRFLNKYAILFYKILITINPQEFGCYTIIITYII